MKKGGKYHGFQSTQESVLFNVYTDVRFQSMFPDRRGIAISVTLDAPPGRAQSDTPRARAAFWEGVGGKRLMQGGLVGLVWKRGTSVDVYLGTVATSQKDLVESAKKEKGRIQLRIVFFDAEATLRIVDEIRSSKSTFNHTKLLVEAPIMYEAIRPFLEALKVVPEAVPFERYLPHRPAKKLASTPILPPRMATKPGFKYQLASLFPPEAGVTSLQLDVQDGSSVAIARQELVQKSRLDASQAHAVVDTLTREVSLIQGYVDSCSSSHSMLELITSSVLQAQERYAYSDLPQHHARLTVPFQSFTGVELIRVLIANKCGPILMIAFTNHALDHLLAAVLDIGIQKIVRLGSRSADERISQFSIENLERTAEAQAGLKQTSHQLHRELKAIDRQIEELVQKIHRKDPTPEELFDHLRVSYPEHSHSLNLPSNWILDLYAQWQEVGEEWQTVGRGGKARGRPDTTLYSYWIAGHDLSYINNVHRLASQGPPKAAVPLHPQSKKRVDEAERSSNRFVVPDSPAAALTSTEDQSEDEEEGSEPWQKTRWSAADALRDTVQPSPSLTPSPAPPSPSPSPIPFAQTIDPDNFESGQFFSDAFFRHYGIPLPLTPNSDRGLDELCESPNIWSMSLAERTRLNAHWVDLVSTESYELYQEEFANLQRKHETARQRHEEGRNEVTICLAKTRMF